VKFAAQHCRIGPFQPCAFGVAAFPNPISKDHKQAYYILGLSNRAKGKQMRGSVDMNFLFTLGELQRLVRAYADRQAARYGMTRAQWAVLAKVERYEGLKQSELAEMMDMQPITLTRLIDKLCDNGWIERRGDDNDRRVNRLYLRKAARPLLGKLAGLRSELTATALQGINPADAHRLLTQLEAIKENVRNAIQDAAGDQVKKEQHYG
jgi:MarR family transcriptional regulator for hemolysin